MASLSKYPSSRSAMLPVSSRVTSTAPRSSIPRRLLSSRACRNRSCGRRDPSRGGIWCSNRPSTRPMPARCSSYPGIGVRVRGGELAISACRRAGSCGSRGSARRPGGRGRSLRVHPVSVLLQAQVADEVRRQQGKDIRQRGHGVVRAERMFTDRRPAGDCAALAHHLVSPALARYAAATSPFARRLPPRYPVSGHYAPLLPQLPVEDAVYSPYPGERSTPVDPTLIAVAQLAITVAEPDANRRAAADAVAEAAAAGARLVVLPELCDSGYVFDAADPAAEARAWPARRGQHHPAAVARAGRPAPAGDRRRLLRARRRRAPVQQRRPGGRVRHSRRLPQGAPVGFREARLHSR